MFARNGNQVRQRFARGLELPQLDLRIDLVQINPQMIEERIRFRGELARFGIGCNDFREFTTFYKVGSLIYEISKSDGRVALIREQGGQHGGKSLVSVAAFHLSGNEMQQSLGYLVIR